MMRRALGLFLIALSFTVLVALAPTTLVEGWVRTVFPLWATVTAALFHLSPVSSTLLAATGVLIGLLTASLLAPAGRRLRRAGVLVVGTTSVLAASFVVTWGAAYHRATLAELLDLPPAGADLATLGSAFDRLMDEVHASAPVEPLHTRSAAELDAAVRRAARCVADVDEAVTGRRVAVPSGVRRLPAGTLMRAGYGGIALPWLLEPHVDDGLPGAAWLAVATHEIVHAAGWAREADTDALSVLAGLACDDASVRYATALHGAAVVGAVIASVTVPDHPARAAVSARFAALPEVARADRVALAESVERHRHPATAETVGRVYDAYLRSQGVEAGVADYALAGGILAAALMVCPAVDYPWCG
jgi:hypothetical protein